MRKIYTSKIFYRLRNSNMSQVLYVILKFIYHKEILLYQHNNA